MLNIKELSDLLTDATAPAEDTRTTLIVIALVEQRMVLERIAELLDVHHMDLSDIESDLKRIVKMLDDDDPDSDKDDPALRRLESEEDEPDSDQPKTALSDLK